MTSTSVWLITAEVPPPLVPQIATLARAQRCRSPHACRQVVGHVANESVLSNIHFINV